MLESEDEKWVIVNRLTAEKIKSANRMARLLSVQIPILYPVLKIIAELLEATYDDLGKKLSIDRGDQQLHAAVCWLVHLKFINRDNTQKPHVFSSTLNGKKYLKKL